MNLTQAMVAEKSEINRSYYGLIENGQRNPSLKNAIAIAETLCKPLVELFPDEIFFANKCYEMK